MVRLLTAFILALTVSSTAFSQGPAPRSAPRLQSRTTLPGNVTAQAVLIPRVDARRIFGKEIADNYAIIEINVGNKSPDAALIIHGIFIDYTRWPLSGTPLEGSALEGLFREGTMPFQASTIPNQVASEEYRVVRGQLLDSQMWSKRNWTMRLLTLSGSLASAYAFSLNEEGIIRGLNAFSGTVVPGVREAWPDGTIDQLNRISDFGYQTNKVIPKQGAEVIVGFFPIDRFLTPGFKKLFLKSPALFFAPLQMLVDRSLKNDANTILRSMNPSMSVETLAPHLPCYLQMVNSITNRGLFRTRLATATERCEAEFGLTRTKQGDQEVLQISDEKKFKLFMAIDFISQMSLNTVTVTIDGVMTVETSTIPAKLDAVVFNRLPNCGDATQPCFWADVQAAGGVRSGRIEGSYLTGGAVEIENADGLGITDIIVDTANSTDQELRFSFKLNQPIAPQTLRFIVSKAHPNAQPGDPRLDSLPRDVPMGYTITTPPVASAVKATGNELTVTGSGFFDIPSIAPLTVEVTGKDGKKVAPKIKSQTSTELKLTIENPKPDDCWTVKVLVGTRSSEAVTTCK